MKITLMDIMESLNSDNMEDAQAALHEWFVEQSKTVHSQLMNNSASNEEFEENVIESDDYEAKVDAVKSKKFSEMTDEEKEIFFDNLPDADSDWDDLQARIGYPIADGEPKIITFVIFGKKLTIATIDEEVPNHEMVLRKLKAQVPGAQEITRIGGFISSAYSDDEDFDPEAFAPVGVVLKVEDVMSESAIDSENEPAEYYVHGKWSVSGLSDGEVFELSKDVKNSVGHPDEHGYDKNYTVMGWYADTMEDAQEMLNNLRNLGLNNLESYVRDPDTGEKLSESEDDYNDLVAELKEAFTGLETVSDKLQNVEGAQVGEQGKVPVNTKATLPSHKGDKRVGGEAVEIKGKGHTGHALEKAPKVADVKVKGNVQNSKDDPKAVSTEKSALLNKMDGSVNTQSVISGKGAKGLKK